MAWLKNNRITHHTGERFIKNYVKFRSSIYGRVIFIITTLSLFLFISFWLIFRSVNERYMQTVINETGNNVGVLVESALYHSMLENDKSALQNTLMTINEMSGIDEVIMYDSDDNIAHSSFISDTSGHGNSNCISCHSDLDKMFPRLQKSYRIIDATSACKMFYPDDQNRHLLYKLPILNRPSCYESSCHFHKATDIVLGSLLVKIPLAGLDAALQKSSTDFFLLATLITILMSSFLIFFTMKKIKNPLNEIINASVAVANGDKSKRLEMKPNQLDDMRMVAQALNDMLDNLQAANNELQNWSQQLEYKVQKKSEELGAAQNELIHIEKIASLGKLSLSVAHEINNPLSGILIYAKLVSKQLNNQDIDPAKKDVMLKHLKLIENETKRCGDIVKGLLDFSRKDQNEFESKHIHDILRKTYDLMMHPMKIKNISFLLDLTAEHDMISCSPNQIKQACVALLVNASEAVNENGEIIFRTLNKDTDNVIVQIIDNGTGISAEDLSHIFEPFFSTKQNKSGIGLGLAIVHGIVQGHKGKIEVRSEPGKGTAISITFPLIKD